MAKESVFQGKFVKWLRENGFIVVKNQAGPGVPIGFPDCSWWYKGRSGFLEFKRSNSASFRPRQKEWLEQLGRCFYARVVFPENSDTIKKEIICIKEELDEGTAEMEE